MGQWHVVCETLIGSRHLVPVGEGLRRFLFQKRLSAGDEFRVITYSRCGEANSIIYLTSLTDSRDLDLPNIFLILDFLIFCSLFCISYTLT